MADRKMEPAMRRYTIGVAIAMSLYVVTLLGVNRWFDHSPPVGTAGYVVALLPALCIIAVFVLIGRLLIELKDEYVRMLLVRQSLVATGFAMALATAWGFLESFHLVPHVMAYWAAIVWFAGLGLGGLVNAVLERRA